MAKTNKVDEKYKICDGDCDSCDGDCVKHNVYDAVNHPLHYVQGGVECIDAIESAVGDEFSGYLAGNVIKYVWRYRNKGGVEDLKKARWYIDRLIEREGGRLDEKAD